MRRKVGSGQTPRQPGQVRKEAAATSSGLGRESAFHLMIFKEPPLYRARSLSQASDLQRMSYRA